MKTKKILEVLCAATLGSLFLTTSVEALGFDFEEGMLTSVAGVESGTLSLAFEEIVYRRGTCEFLTVDGVRIFVGDIEVDNGIIRIVHEMLLSDAEAEEEESPQPLLGR